MYIAVEDLITPSGYFTETQLAEYSSNEGESVIVHTERIEAMITARTSEIDSYLRGRYELPISGDTTLLKEICKNLVSFDLVFNRGKLTEKIQGWETRAYTLLEKIQKGEIIIVEQNTSDIRFKASVRGRLLDTRFL